MMFDPNLPDDEKVTEQETVTDAVKGNESLADSDVEEDSKYPEIRAAVSNKDDPNMPCVLAILFPLRKSDSFARKRSEFG